MTFCTSEYTATATAKLLQSCPTLCDPIAFLLIVLLEAGGKAENEEALRKNSNAEEQIFSL